MVEADRRKALQKPLEVSKSTCSSGTLAKVARISTSSTTLEILGDLIARLYSTRFHYRAKLLISASLEPSLRTKLDGIIIHLSEDVQTLYPYNPSGVCHLAAAVVQGVGPGQMRGCYWDL